MPHPRVNQLLKDTDEFNDAHLYPYYQWTKDENNPSSGGYDVSKYSYEYHKSLLKKQLKFYTDAERKFDCMISIKHFNYWRKDNGYNIGLIIIDIDGKEGQNGMDLYNSDYMKPLRKFPTAKSNSGKGRHIYIPVEIDIIMKLYEDFGDDMNLTKLLIQSEVYDVDLLTKSARVLGGQYEFEQTKYNLPDILYGIEVDGETTFPTSKHIPKIIEAHREYVQFKGRSTRSSDSDDSSISSILSRTSTVSIDVPHTTFELEKIIPDHLFSAGRDIWCNLAKVYCLSGLPLNLFVQRSNCKKYPSDENFKYDGQTMTNREWAILEFNKHIPALEQLVIRNERKHTKELYNIACKYDPDKATSILYTSPDLTMDVKMRNLETETSTAGELADVLSYSLQYRFVSDGKTVWYIDDTNKWNTDENYIHLKDACKKETDRLCNYFKRKVDEQYNERPKNSKKENDSWKKDRLKHIKSISDKVYTSTITHVIECVRQSIGLVYKRRSDIKFDKRNNLFAFSDYCYDFDKKEKVIASPEDFVKRHTEYPYPDRTTSNPNIRARLIETLERILGYPEQLNKFYERIIGAMCCSTLSSIFFIQGGAGNGKSTITDFMKHIFGQYADTISPQIIAVSSNINRTVEINDINNQNIAICKIEGLRYLYTSEPPENKTGTVKLAENNIKVLTGHDLIIARNGHEFDLDKQGFYNQAQIVVSLNSNIRCSTGYDMRRRLCPQIYPNVFKPAHDLKEQYTDKGLAIPEGIYERDPTLSHFLSDIETKQEFMRMLLDYYEEKARNGDDISKREYIKSEIEEQWTNELFDRQEAEGLSVIAVLHSECEPTTDAKQHISTMEFGKLVEEKYREKGIKANSLSSIAQTLKENGIITKNQNARGGGRSHIQGWKKKERVIAQEDNEL